MPGETGVTVVTMLVCFFIFACEAAGASRARHSLRPLVLGPMIHASLGRHRAAGMWRCVSFTRDVILRTATASGRFIPPPSSWGGWRIVSAAIRCVGWGLVQKRTHPHIGPHPGLRLAVAVPPH